MANIFIVTGDVTGSVTGVVSKTCQNHDRSAFKDRKIKRDVVIYRFRL